MSAEQVQDPGPAPAAHVAAALRAALERALALGGRPVHRLGSSGTSVTFSVGGDAGAGVTLLLDRHPPVVLSGEEAAEITIDLSPEQATAFLRGELILPNEVLSGAVRTRGPVRSYLRCDPVLRALMGRVRDEPTAARGCGAGRRRGMMRR
jgi:hypothetical protein